MNAFEFSDGSPMTIRLVNFLTFSEAQFKLGAHLNLVLGQNGSGKSSFLCGLCLVLGGTPKVLARSDDFGSFVKHGSDEGSVEVTIRDSKLENDPVLTLVLRKDNRVDYRVDGRKLSPAAYRAFLAPYNFQVTNPCVFLAQDKVKTFAQQSDEQLLENTEKASSSELVKAHEELKKLAALGGNHASNREKVAKKMTRVEHELAVVQPRAESYRRKQSMRAKFVLLTQKEAFMVCQQSEQVVADAQKTARHEEHKLNRANADLDSAQAELSVERAKDVENRTEYNNESDAYRTLSRKRSDLVTADTANAMAREARLVYESRKKEHAAWITKLKGSEEFLEQQKQLIQASSANKDASKENKEHLSRDLQKCTHRETEIGASISKTASDLTKMRRERDALRDKMDASERKIEERVAILGEGDDWNRCADAWRWYENNRQRFKKPVFVPLISMEMNYPDSAQYLENLISRADLTMFIFGCQEDERLLLNSSHPWKINSSILEEHRIEGMLRETPLSAEMRQFGFERTAFQLFSGPSTVRAYLNSVCGLSGVPIGNAHTKERMDDVCKTISGKVSIILVPGERVSIKRSLYRDEASVCSGSLRKERLLKSHRVEHAIEDCDVDDKLRALERDTEKLKNELKELKSSQETVAARGQQLRGSLSKIRMEEGSEQQAKVILTQAQKRCAEVRKSEPEVESAKEAVKRVEMAARAEVAREVSTLLNMLERQIEISTRKTVIAHTRKKAQRTLLNLGERVEQLKVVSDRKQIEVDEHRGVLERAGRDSSGKRRILMDIAWISSTIASNLIDSMKEILHQLKHDWRSNSIPDELGDVRQAIADERSRIDIAPSDGSQQDVERTEVLLAEQSKLNGDLQSALKEVEDWEKNMKELLEKWLGPIRRLIQSIDVRYRRFFEQMNCAGEIHLREPDDKLDVEHYGVKIMVKFRESESLTQLTHRRQSGGERSVSTMLYLMALQEMCTLPLCCVDEINQGMDPCNERRVLEMLTSQMTDRCSALSRTQYFILSPKLIPDLTYGDCTVVHVVLPDCNSENVQSSTESTLAILGVS